MINDETHTETIGDSHDIEIPIPESSNLTDISHF
jgi:hypothetical protein